jgi:hypothetical protein
MSAEFTNSSNMMKQVTRVLIIFFFLLSAMAAGQQIVNERPSVIVNGVVIDAGTEAVIPNVQYSVTGRGGGVTDQHGQFALFATRGDTVEFRMVGYKSAMLAIGNEHTASGYLALIAMVTDTLEVGEIIILPQIADLRTIATSPSILDSREYENARNNIAVSVHQGLTGTEQLVDSRANYELLRRQQKVDAFERGGIPSDKMVGLSPFMIIPAFYLLVNGLPEKPKAPAESISNKDLDKLRKAYRERIFKQK